MANNSDAPMEKDRNFLSEVDGVEKQLWTLNHTKGLLHSDALDMYRKICVIYEKIFQNNNDLAKLYDAEYSLWKLHYRYIDEFRKRVKKTSADGEGTMADKAKNPTNIQKSNENQTARFKSFLLEATEFYKKILQSMRKQCEEASSEMKRMKTYQFLCHRFLVCLGDISRYREQYVILDIRVQNWSVSASYYLEAAKIWPDSGNPHNQIAVLATYVGDVFLALYHCVRSLAVKEPFPDAWNNLILLFEKNSSSHLELFSRRVQFDFLKPSEKSSFLFKDDDDYSNRIMETEDINSFEANLWPLIIRMMSFFFLKFSLEEFLCTFACTMRWLEALMELDDRKLSTALESYSRIDSVKTGPFQAVQFVSVLIFMLQNVFNRPEVSGSKEMKDFALAGAFVCMGRLGGRCLKSKKLDSCPLLPAIVVFVEWFGGAFVEEEISGIDENSKSSMARKSSMAYFFDLFVDLLEILGFYASEADSCGDIPLWEDYELRGFAPVASTRELRDFAAHLNSIDSFEGRAEDRAFRIINAAVKISNRLNGPGKWIIYNESERKFYTDKMIKTREKKELEKAKSDVSFLHQLLEDTEEYEEKINGDKCESLSTFRSTRNLTAVEEEEVILFKPLARYNSAPPCTPHAPNGHSRPNDSDQTQTPPSDECLLRATSLLLAQNFNDFNGNESDENREQFINDPAGGSHFSETCIPSGPPSLSAWVVNQISSSNNKEKGINSFSKHSLRPIEEIVPTVFDDRRQESETVRSCSSTLHLVPEPSAPLLPEDAVWYNGIDSHFSDRATSVCDTFSAPALKMGDLNWMATYRPSDHRHRISDFASPRQLTSSEWLRQYQQNQNIDRINRHLYPVLHSNDLSSRPFDHLGQWLNPPAYCATENRTEPPIPDYQRPGPYWRDAVTDARNEQVLLLQYLKEREWRLQQDPGLRGDTYMGT